VRGRVVRTLIRRKAVGACVAAVGASALALAGCGSASSSGGGGSAGGGTHHWTFLVYAPATPGTVSAPNLEQEFAQAVDTQTHGQLKITLSPPGELPYTLDQALQVVGAGQAQMADGSVFIAGESNAVGLLGIPTVVQTVPQFAKILPKAMPFIRQEFAKYGATPLFAYAAPPQLFWGTGSPMTSLAGLNGKRVRVSTPGQAYFVEKFGGNPTTMDTADVLPGLQRGVINTAVTAASSALPSGWGPSLKWGYKFPLNLGVSFIAVNSKALAALTPSVRATLLRLAQTYQSKMLTTIPGLEKTDQQLFATKYGIKETAPSTADLAEARKIMGPYATSWAKSHGETALLDTIEKTLGESSAG
jgi:TRAP-type transport system periplasmic protein